MPGRVHPASRAAAADVPSVVSALSPAISEFASPVGTACSHAALGTGTTCPNRSVTDRTGTGGHHVPPLISVAETFASSSGLTGLLPSVNDGLSRKYLDCGWSRRGSADARSGVPPASLVRNVFRSPSRSATASMPIFVSRPTNAVFRDVASPSAR
jgi:hypothetical protein